MTTRTRSKTASISTGTQPQKDGNRDFKESSKASPKITSYSKRKPMGKESPCTKQLTVSPAKNEPQAAKKARKSKKDTHAFSSYFESNRETFQYNYHLSPAAQLCVGNNSSPGQMSKQSPKKTQRKRKAGITDIFDYCSDEEGVLPDSKKKTKLFDVDTESKSKPVPVKRNSRQVSSDKSATKRAKVQASPKPGPSRMKSVKKAAPVVKKSRPKGSQTASKTEVKSKARKTTPKEEVVRRRKPNDTKAKQELSPIATATRTRYRRGAKQKSVTTADKLAQDEEHSSKVSQETSTESVSGIELATPEQKSPVSANPSSNNEVAAERLVDKESEASIDKQTDEYSLLDNETVPDEESKETNSTLVGEEIRESIHESSNEEEVVTEINRSQAIKIDVVEDKCSSISSEFTGSRPSVGECSADISLTETEESFKRKSFDHQLKVNPQRIPSLSRSSTWPKTTASVSCSIPTALTQSVTMVRNVRQAHECLQHGQNIQFRDQIEYLIDSMRPSQPLSVRCLSTLSLATECLKTEFCRQLRAHGLVNRIMILLKDAVHYPSLQVTAVALFYVVSQDLVDRSDLDTTCLELLLALMQNLHDESIDDGDQTVSSCGLSEKTRREYQRIKAKARGILEKCPIITVREKGKDEEDTEEVLDNVTEATEARSHDDEGGGISPADLSTSELICECFYNITSTQSSCAKIKEDMRILGILDVIANKAISMIELIDRDKPVTELFIKVMRIMKLLENVTFMNQTNQSYLTVFDGSLLITKLCSCLVLLKNQIISGSSSSRYLLLSCLLGVLKVLLNLTHDHELGSLRVGEQTKVLESILECVFQIPGCFSGEKGFDVLILSLGLLINLVEHSAPNRDLFYETKIEVCGNGEKKWSLAVKAVTELFLLHYTKSEETTIDVPTPQNLSQRTPTSSPMKMSFSPNVKKDPPVPLASRLKIHKDIKGYRSPAKLKGLEGGGDEKGVDGMDWLPTEENEEGEEDEDEEEEEPVSDSLVFNREDFDAALTQAGKHMEDSIVASYSALLLAVLAKYSKVFAESLKEDLPNKSYKCLVSVLKEFIEFMSMAGSSTNRSGLESIRKIVKHIEALQDQAIVV